jgi:putative flippase GtrA
MPFLHNFYAKLRIIVSSNFPRSSRFLGRQNSLIKCLVAGGVATIIDLILLFFFHGLMNIQIVSATTMAFVCSFLFSFMLQKFWTFQNHNREQTSSQLFLYVLNIMFTLYLNGLFMHLLVNNFSVWYLLAQVLVNIVIGLWNWVIYKFIIFRND